MTNHVMTITPEAREFLELREQTRHEEVVEALEEIHQILYPAFASPDELIDGEGSDEYPSHSGYESVADFYWEMLDSILQIVERVR